MTEAEWLGESLFPEGMLLRLHGEWMKGRVGKSPERGLRLFGCACCRQAERLVNDPRVRNALDVVERHIDGAATDDELRAAGDAVERAWEASMEGASRTAHVMPSLTAPEPSLHLLEAAAYAAGRTPGSIILAGRWHALAMHAALQCRLAVLYAASEGDREQQPVTEAELRTQRALLRDCLGNPFRPSPPPAPHVVGWNDGTVRRLARQIYEGRAWENLPVLADALEEAGCEDADLLGHCRGPGPHVRGCWAAERLLART